MHDTLIAEAQKLLEETPEVPSVPEDNAPFLQRASAYAQLSLLARRLEAYTKEVSGAMAQIEPQLQLDMAAAGMPNCNINGVTIYQKTETWVRKRPEKDGVTTDMVCEALCKIGRSDMVGESYSPSSLKSLVTEMIANGQEIPPVLAGLIDVGSRTVLSTLKTGSR